jgi:hypothetical protein
VGAKIKRTDYESLSPDDRAQWIRSMVEVNRSRTFTDSQSGPHSADEELLVAVVTDLVELNPRWDLNRFGLFFGQSKRRLLGRDFPGRAQWLTVSRYGMGDWDAALTAVLQELAGILSEDPKRGKRWTKMVGKLGASPAPVEFIFREPVGSVRTLKTPYGDLSVAFGVTELSTANRTLGGRVISASRTHVELEEKPGVRHRLRIEEVHPDSGKLDRVVPLTKLVGYLTTVHFGKSSLERSGKTFYALEHISGRRVSVLAADGEKLIVKVDELTI